MRARCTGRSRESESSAAKRPPLGPRLKALAQQQKSKNQQHRVEINLPSRRGRNRRISGVGKRHARSQAHQRVHVGRAVAAARELRSHKCRAPPTPPPAPSAPAETSAMHPPGSRRATADTRIRQAIGRAHLASQRHRQQHRRRARRQRHPRLQVRACRRHLRRAPRPRPPAAAPHRIRPRESLPPVAPARPAPDQTPRSRDAPSNPRAPAPRPPSRAALPPRDAGNWRTSSPERAASAILSCVQPQVVPIRSGRSPVDGAQFQIRRVPRLGNGGDGQADRRGLLIGGQPRCAQPNLLHHDPGRRCQRLAHSPYARATMHSIDFQRKFGQFSPSRVYLMIGPPEGFAPAGSSGTKQSADFEKGLRWPALYQGMTGRSGIHPRLPKAACNISGL